MDIKRMVPSLNYRQDDQWRVTTPIDFPCEGLAFIHYNRCSGFRWCCSLLAFTCKRERERDYGLWFVLGCNGGRYQTDGLLQKDGSRDWGFQATGQWWKKLEITLPTSNTGYQLKIMSKNYCTSLRRISAYCIHSLVGQWVHSQEGFDRRWSLSWMGYGRAKALNL